MREQDIEAVKEAMSGRPPAYHEQTNLANAVTSLLKTREEEIVPGFYTIKLRWSATYSQTPGFTTQTAFFVPIYRQTKPTLCEIEGHCMVLVDRVMLLYTPAEDVATYIYDAVKGGRCWIPGW